MKADSIFFEIFQKLPQTLFDLLGEPANQGDYYDFRSVEVKQTAYRIDGVFVPKLDSSDQTVIFVEVQFQKDQGLYDRLFSEVMMYLSQNPDVEDWKAVVIFPKRSIEPDNTHRHLTLLQSSQFQAIFQEDILDMPTDLLGIELMQLIVSREQNTDQYLKKIIQDLKSETDSQRRAIIEVVSTIMVYKFPELTREEIEAMFTISDLKQTKVYQEALDEGRAEGQAEGRAREALSLMLRQLNKRFGQLAPELERRVRSLSLEQIERLSDALLDFGDRSDLEAWLEEI